MYKNTFDNFTSKKYNKKISFNPEGRKKNLLFKKLFALDHRHVNAELQLVHYIKYLKFTENKILPEHAHTSIGRDKGNEKHLSYTFHHRIHYIIQRFITASNATIL